MIGRKVLQILSMISTTEWQVLERLAANKWFAPDANVARLVALLKPHYPPFADEKALHRHALFAKLFPNQPFNDQDFRTLVSRLNKLVEELLIQLELKSSAHDRQRLLLQATRKRELFDHFELQLRRIRRALDAEPYRNLEWYDQLILLQEARYFHQNLTISRTVENRLQPLVDSIDLRFFYSRLQYSCEVLNLQNILSVEVDQSFLNTITAWLDAHPVEDVPGITIYRQILRTLQQPEQENHYHTLRDLLRQHLDAFPAEELKTMFTFAQNYCIKQANQGNQAYLQELFELYKLQIERNIINAEGSIAQFDYKNIVAVGLRVDAYDWVAHFIETERNHLSESVRENAYNYNLARLLYSQGQFRPALRALLRVEYTDVYYELDSRSLLLKTYYELEEYEAFLSLGSSFGLFLRRNKQISDYQRTVYRNLIKYARKLFRIKMGGKQNPKHVLDEIHEVKQVADLKWLTAKGEALL